MKTDLAALAVAVVVAAGVAQLDLGSSASASIGLDAQAATASARAQGLAGGVATARLRTDLNTGDVVWRVTAESETAVLDAKTGELLSLDWAPAP